MSKQGDVLVGLDIGTSKICVVVAEVNEEDGALEIVGVGNTASRGLSCGSVVNIDQTVESVQSALEKAEFISGVSIQSAFVGVAGRHIRSFNTNGVVAIKNKIVSQEDIDRVVDVARKTHEVPPEHEIIHVLPQEYIVDGQEGVIEPSGMAGVRLECKVHIVTGAIPAIQNIIRCVEEAGLSVESLVLQPFASSLAALSDDERDLGVAIVDIGCGTTDLALISGGALRYSVVIPVGGSHVTRDISIGLKTPDYQAEKIKIEHGCAVSTRLCADEEIKVPSVGGRSPRVLSRQMLAEIIEPRMEEILMLVRREIQKSGREDLLPAGVVLTGGGSLIEGADELAEGVLQMPARIGEPGDVGGLADMVSGPMYSTAVGLVTFAMREGYEEEKHGTNGIAGNSLRQTTERIRNVLADIFR